MQHHYEGHWKGWWALKIETILGPEMATSVASAILAPKKLIVNSYKKGVQGWQGFICKYCS
jgi:hypothetical protein